MAGEQPTPVPSGDDQNPSGASGDQDPKHSKTGDSSEGNSVSWETYQKTLSQEKNLRSRIKELEDRESQRELEAAKAKENFKEVSEHYKAKFESTDSELKELRESILNTSKAHALNDVLDGKVDRKYWHLIDTSKIVTDENGNIDKMSLTKYAEQFSKEYSEVIERRNTADVPPHTPRGANGSYISMEKFKQMSIDPSVSKKDLLEASKRIQPM